MNFGLYQETRMRMLHRMIDGYIDAGLDGDDRDRSELDRWRVPLG